jgi:hypothetical protein
MKMSFFSFFFTNALPLHSAVAQSDAFPEAHQAQALLHSKISTRNPSAPSMHGAMPIGGPHGVWMLRATRQASGCAYLLPVEARAPDEQAAELIARRDGDWTVDCRHGVGITVTARILHVSAPRGLYVLAPPPPRFPTGTGTACACLSFDADMYPRLTGNWGPEPLKSED